MVAASLAAAFLPDARAEWVVGGYLGGSHTADSDLTLAQSTGSRVFRGVGWESRSFQSPPYYGLQVGRYFGDGPWGIRLDFCHDKVYGRSDSLQPPLQRFSLSHGLNTLTADVVARSRAGPFSIYGGVGAGTLFPHVEVETSGTSMEQYQWFRGVAGKVFAGVQLDVTGPLAMFLELRLSLAHVHVRIPDGTATTSLFTQHAAAGALFRL